MPIYFESSNRSTSFNRKRNRSKLLQWRNVRKVQGKPRSTPEISFTYNNILITPSDTLGFMIGLIAVLQYGKVYINCGVSITLKLQDVMCAEQMEWKERRIPRSLVSALYPRLLVIFIHRIVRHIMPRVMVDIGEVNLFDGNVLRELFKGLARRESLFKKVNDGWVHVFGEFDIEFDEQVSGFVVPP